MSVRVAKDRFLALPWVYDLVRPLAVGGIDHAALARFCEIGAHERVFDLGCGTASLLPYLTCAGYLGSDLDAAALARASRFAGDNVRFIHGDDWDDALGAHQADVVLMMGVVHHLSDDEFLALVQRLRRVAHPPSRLVTMDVTFFRGRWINNTFSRLDRGRHVRTPEAYEMLFRDCGLDRGRRGFVDTRLGWARYVGYHLAPDAARPGGE